MSVAQKATHALRTLAQLSAYAATRTGHDRADRETYNELAVAGTDLALPAGLSLQWLGVAGFSLTYENTTILIDPFVTRKPLGDMLRRRVWQPEPTLLERHVPKCDAILLGHTHFDHALDAPAIAIRDNAKVYGSSSSQTLLGLYGIAKQAVVVEPASSYEIGPFVVSFVPSVHSKLVLGLAVPNGGELTCDHLDGLTSSAYCCGDVWGIRIQVGGVTIYHQGSADLIDDALSPQSVDVFLCGIAGRQVSDRYLQRIIPKLDPAVIVAMHHDDFFRPFDAKEQGFAFGVDVARFPDEVQAVTRHSRVVTLERTLEVGQT
ncbi:MAG: MBL fold metallo-hydrolase [Acidimicrobiales bacterium]|nr:MBL fold metallo-hydrolase [Acidimicrobiales bacterium]